MIRVDEATVVLGIESSCDETAAAVVMGGNDVLSSVVATQIEQHARFGGVVPEIASRAHVEAMTPVIRKAIQDSGVGFERIDAVAATVGPGLVGALLVGVSTAKSIALALNKPFIGVNHLEAHLYAALLDDPNVEFPMLVVLVSGGNTLLVNMESHGKYSIVGQTIDDAAGEAFDKGETFSGVDYELGLKAVHELKRVFDTEELAPIALRWILMFDAVSTVIPGASRAEQVRQNTQAAELPPLTEQEMNEVEYIYNKYIKSSVHHLW